MLYLSDRIDAELLHKGLEFCKSGPMRETERAFWRRSNG